MSESGNPLRELLRSWSSRLAPEYEVKRKAIARAHNFSVVAFLFLSPILLGGGLFLALTVSRGDERMFLFIAIPLGLVLLGLGVTFIVRLDGYLCKKHDFFCPSCRKSLYFDPKMTAGTLLDARCPRCNASLPSLEDREGLAEEPKGC